MGRLSPQQERDLEVLWDYHQMGHELQPTDAIIGLGSHDLGVAQFSAQLFKSGIAPLVIFTGANAPTTMERFPRGEAVHYREEAIRLGIPAAWILVETKASNTGENIQFTRDLLAGRGLHVDSITLVSRPYQQRRAFATCRKLWPEVHVVCASQPLPLGEYILSIGDARRVADMMVGDTQRIDIYAERGFAIPQDIPAHVVEAYERLVAAGYTSRLI
ncbi:YdcF family protein [Nonomuraea sp. NPDC055795]